MSERERDMEGSMTPRTCIPFRYVPWLTSSCTVSPGSSSRWPAAALPSDPLERPPLSGSPAPPRCGPAYQCLAVHPALEWGMTSPLSVHLAAPRHFDGLASSDMPRQGISTVQDVTESLAGMRGAFEYMGSRQVTPEVCWLGECSVPCRAELILMWFWCDHCQIRDPEARRLIRVYSASG